MQTIRLADTNDCELINHLAKDTFPFTYRSILTPEQIEYMMHWMYDPENIYRQMTEEGHVYFIAYQDDEPAGYVSVRKDEGQIYHLEKIYVLPKFQKMHFGRVLFQTVEDYVRKQCPSGDCAVELNVNRQNPALDFYKHMGMRIDRQGDFPIGNGYYMNDYIMRKDL